MSAIATQPSIGDARSFIASVFAEAFMPPTRMLCSAWSDTYRVIAKGPERGPWRTTRTPFLREPMDCTDPEHPAQKVVLMFATQLGKTEVLYNACLKRIHLAPQDMMFVQPTLNDALDHSRERFTPTVRATPEVARRMPEQRSRDETNTWRVKQIANGVATMFFAGANSARSLASKPLGFIAADEIDGYPLDVDSEGDPLSLAWERMSNFPERKLILASTPTVKDFSRIEAEYLASDRRRYHVVCPHCGELQVLVWGHGYPDVAYGIQWLSTPAGAARPETAVYICRHCAAAIGEHHKPDMLAQGQWIAEAPGAQRGLVVGFNLPKLYSPLGWKSWPMLVDDWIAAQTAKTAGDHTKLKTFVNTSLAETYEETGDRADEHAIKRRADDWPLGTVLHGLCVRTIGVDVQADRLHLLDYAWGPGMTRQVVNRRVLWGDTSIPEGEPGSPWDQLTEYRLADVRHQSGRPVQLVSTFVDSGYNTQAVYAYARKHRHAEVHACKGRSDGTRAILGKPTDQEFDWRGVKIARGVKLWPVGTDSAKHDIHGRLHVAEVGPGYVHLTRQLPDEFFSQLTSERLVSRLVKGRPRHDWIKPPGRRNEDLDCSVYALAAAHWAGIERWRVGEWQRWMASVEQVDLFDAAQQPAAVQTPAPPPPSLHGRISLQGNARFG